MNWKKIYSKFTIVYARSHLLDSITVTAVNIGIKPPFLFLGTPKVFCVEKSSTSITTLQIRTCSPGLPFLAITHTPHSLFLSSKLDSLPWLLPYWNKSQSFEEIGICKCVFFMIILLLLRLRLMLCMWSCFSLVLLHWIQSLCGLDSVLFFYIEFNHSVPLLTISEQTHVKKKLKLYTHMHKKGTIFIHILLCLCSYLCKGDKLGGFFFVSYCWLWSVGLCSSKSRKLWRLQHFWMSCY